MKPGFKLLSILMLALLLAASATAQINWLKQDGSVKYLAWDDGSKSKTIYSGTSTTFATGYFGSTISSTVHLTVTINSKTDGKIVSTLVSKDVDVNPLGYEVITVAPSNYKNKAGEYIIVIKLKDANTELADTSLFLKVKPNYITEIHFPFFPIDQNDAPEMNNINDQEVKENQNLQFTVSATDAEADDLEYAGQVCSLQAGTTCYAWSPLSEVGASLNEDTGVFKWKPGYDFVKHPLVFIPNLSRITLFRFKAEEASGNKESDWEKIIVTVRDKNRNPKFSFLLNKIVQEESLLQFTVKASDADDDELKYSVLSGLPPGASFDTGSHKFKWVPPIDQSGVYSVTFKVKDKFGGKATKTIIITVTDKVVVEPQCKDGMDNDGDTLADEKDPGCHTDGDQNNKGTYDPEDNDETDHPEDKPQCSDGVDNDADTYTDYPADLGCSNLEDDDETDEPPVEQPQCSDGVDNDADTYTDYPADLGCSNLEDDDESDDPLVDEPQCSDGEDNDNDMLVDLDDPGCENNPEDDDEFNAQPPENPTQPAVFTNIKFKSAAVEEFFVHAGDVMAVHVSIFNNGKTNLKDVEVQAVMYDLGAFGSTSDFTLSKGEGANKSIYVPVPEEAQSGWYLVKITAKNYHYHTSTYRLVYVGSNTFK